MIRRSPTRIELRLDDLQEYENARKEQDAAKKERQGRKDERSSFELPSWGGKVSQREIEERIGLTAQEIQSGSSRPSS